MDNSSLTDQQILELTKRVRGQVRFLGLLLRRMELLGFPPDDRLYVATTKAFNAVHALHVECHYMGVRDGVAR